MTTPPETIGPAHIEAVRLAAVRAYAEGGAQLAAALASGDPEAEDAARERITHAQTLQELVGLLTDPS